MLLTIGLCLVAVYVYLGLKRPGIALITLPIACITLFVAAVAEDSPEAALVIPAVFFATLVAIVISKRNLDGDRWPHIWAKWLLMIFGLLLLAVIATILFGHWGSLGFLVLALFITFLISYGLTSRYATAAYIISTIGSSMRQNLPLAMALDSAAAGQTDNRAVILRRIQKWLVGGYPLSEAIKRGYPKCPGRTVAMIAAAEKIDQLPFAFKAIEADMVAKADESRRIRPIHPLYPVIVIVITFFITMMLMTFVFPKFEMILTELLEGAQLPASTRLLLHVTSFVAYEYGWLAGLLILVLITFIVPFSIRIRHRPRQAEKPYLLSRIGDFIKWHLPIVHWFENNYSMVQVVELLRLSFNTGCTVNDAIASTLGLDVNCCFKRKLQKWLTKVERGDNIAAAARGSGLPNSLAWAFDEQINQGNTPAILETLESFHRSNYSYRVNLARLIMWPCLTLVMGAMVGFVVYATFSPLVMIIGVLSSDIMP